ncbi:MAG: aminotransferase class IV [Verrucomicrobia bacterium]|nr:aminotransferase class IV [Verrucomicrobiota bacterium]
MLVSLNGRFVPEARATVSIFDRSFLYGDGVFETIRVHCGIPFMWKAHIMRLVAGAATLRIRPPIAPDFLLGHALELLRRNRVRDGLLRVQLSRGVGVRGYSPKAADAPLLVMTTHPAPAVSEKKIPRWRLITADLRLPTRDGLSPLKTNDRLPFILARAEAEDAGAEEALLLNTEDRVAEAASGNIFWVDRGVVCTPPISDGPLAGITRLAVLQICASLRLKTREVGITPVALRKKSGVFLSQSAWGIVEIAALDGRKIRQSEVVAEIFQGYWAFLKQLCSRLASGEGRI